MPEDRFKTKFVKPPGFLLKDEVRRERFSNEIEEFTKGCKKDSLRITPFEPNDELIFVCEVK